MKNKKIIKYIVFIIITLLIVLLMWNIFPYLKNINTKEGRLIFKEEIQNLGIRGVLLLFLLQALQIIIAILPGEPIEILAGMCYGTWGGTFFLLLSVFLITSIVVLLVKRYGKKGLSYLFDEEKINKLEKKLLEKKGRLELILFLLFFIPGMPKDIVVYIGGLLPIKPLRFILIATIMRFPSIISSTMVGANVSNGSFKTIAIIYGVTFAITILIYIIIRKRDKNKELKEFLNF